jgi:uncharacterized protein (TIGR02246 family)
MMLSGSSVALAVDETASSASSAEKASTSATEKSETTILPVESQIKENARAYADAFSKADAAALAAMWVKNGTYLDAFGNRFDGQAEIERCFNDYFKQADADKNLEIRVESVQSLGDKGALENGVSLIKDASGKVLSEAPYTVVHVLDNGKWEMASVSEQGARYYDNPLEKLRWMSGEWSAKGTGGEASLSTRWMAEHHFMVTTFRVKTNNGETHEDTQVIGVDPRRRAIVSWIFDSEGGFGHGYWSTDGKRWVVDMRRTSPDGKRTEARNYLEPKDSDTFTWRSTGRRLNGLLIPDSDSITVNRIHL